MKTSALIAIGALLAGGVGGYMLRGAGKDEPVAQKEQPSKASPRTGGRGKGTGSRERAPKRSSIRQIMSEPGQTNRMVGLLEYYQGLDASEFEGEAGKLKSLPMAQRMMAMNLLFSSWAEVDPESAMKASSSIGFPEMFMARAGVVTGWAASNPEGLAQAYAENPSQFGMGPGGRGGSETIGLIASEWAKQSPESALRWARTLEEDQQGRAVAGVFSEMARKDPAKAAEMAAGLAQSERESAYRSIAESWALTDYNSADQWINGLSGEIKVEARANAVESLAEVDPLRASQEVNKLPEGEMRDDLVAEVSEEWARKNPKEAFEYLTKSGSEAAIEDGIYTVVRQFSAENPEAALEYVDAQPEGEIRDNAIGGYLRGNRDAPIADSINLAETISDEGDRSRRVSELSYRWIREDAEGAMEYIESSPAIGDSSKERLLEYGERVAAGEETSGRDSPFGRRGRR